MGRTRLPATAVTLLLLGVSLVHAGTEDGERKQEALLRRIIGQMVMVGFTGDGEGAPGYQTVLAQIGDGEITGVIYLGRNIASLDAVRQMNRGLQDLAAGQALIAIDQEGGRIERLTNAVGFKEIPSAAEVASTMGPDQARDLYAGLAGRLADLGFNFNFGPVVDLNLNPSNPIIGKLGRSFSADPVKVAAYGKAFVEGHRDKAVVTSLKHFPGHGSSTGDTHKGIADVTQTWKPEELKPYEDLIASGHADMIMSAHVINDRFALGVPSSLSRATLVGLLRDKMKFEGVIISDDLQMRAISDTTSFADTVVNAVRAGNDILLFANDRNPDPQIPEKVAAILLQEARKDASMLKQLRGAYGRIQKLKRKLKAPALDGVRVYGGK